MYRTVSTESAQPMRRWTICFLVAVLLAILGAGLTAALYPQGRLKRPGFSSGAVLVLSPLPEIQMEPESDHPEPVDRRKPPPAPPRHDALSAAMQHRLLFEAGLIVAVMPDSPPLLSLDLLQYRNLNFALMDSLRLQPWRSGLFAGSWEETKFRSQAVIYGQRYQRFLSNQKSIFNEDWLEGEVLK